MMLIENIVVISILHIYILLVLNSVHLFIWSQPGIEIKRFGIPHDLMFVIY